MKYEISSTEMFDKWFGNLKDRTAKNRILARLSRIENGNFGDFKTLSDNLLELRFTFGGGIRIYYTIKNTQVVLLLNGGNKSNQSKDIQRAYKALIDQE